MLVKIPDENLIRDTDTMLLQSSDQSAKNEYLSKVRFLKVQKEEINTVRSEIDSIKKDMVEIKELMLKLLDKGSNG